jgi:iron complex outermembrane receptor protein
LTHFGEADEYELQMQLATLTYEAKLQLPSKSTSAYIFGFQGIHQENTNMNNRETILLPDALIDNYSGFGFIQQAFGRFNFQTGLRYDYKTLNSQAVGDQTNTETYRSALNKNYGSFSGSLGFTYHPTEELFFRSNLASAYRTPNLAELTSNGPHEAIYELGDDRLQPEKSLEFDLSAHWHKKHFTLDLAGFYNKVNDFIVIRKAIQNFMEEKPDCMYILRRCPGSILKVPIPGSLDVRIQEITFLSSLPIN